MKISALPVNRVYRPLPSAPLFLGDGYREYPPCPELAALVRCFWEADYSREYPSSLVIPDTCADILFEVSPKGVSAMFCGVNDAPFSSQGKKGPAKVYAVRFYAWTVSLFSGESLENSANLCCPAEFLFPGLVGELSRVLASSPSRWIPAAERWLYNFSWERVGNNRIMNAIYSVLANQGRTSLGDMASESVLSPRQLQRIFQKEIGLSPKMFSQLVRYQNLWRFSLSPKFQVLDAVERFGYTDQSHLLREFKRFHGIPLAQARQRAFGNVAFLQDLVPHAVI